MSTSVTTSANQVVAALANGQQITLAGPFPLPVNMAGLGAMMAGAKASASYKGSLGSAIGEEMKNKPAGTDLVIANSSETVIPAHKGYSAAGGFNGGGGIKMGDINVNVSGVDDPKAIANQVAEEIVYAIQRSTYTEIFTS
jgi:hypothetical protein